MTAQLLNDLISPREQRGRHIEPEGLRGFQVDYQLVFGRQLDRKISRLCAIEDPVHVLSCAAVRLSDVRTIADQSAVLGILAEAVQYQTQIKAKDQASRTKRGGD
jgi:hypothetical protein